MEQKDWPRISTVLTSEYLDGDHDHHSKKTKKLDRLETR